MSPNIPWGQSQPQWRTTLLHQDLQFQDQLGAMLTSSNKVIKFVNNSASIDQIRVYPSKKVARCFQPGHFLNGRDHGDVTALGMSCVLFPAVGCLRWTGCGCDV